MSVEQQPAPGTVNLEVLPYSVVEPPVVTDPRGRCDMVPNGQGDIAIFERASETAWLQSDTYYREGEMR
jgi:hypothetical protein